MRLPVPLAVLVALVMSAAPARADIVVSGAFGPNGDVGFVNSPSNLAITFGPDSQGSIYQMDGFVNASNVNLNNNPSSNFGTSGELTYGAPSGLSYQFAATQPDAHDLVLTYQFTNNSSTPYLNFQFLHFNDADIGANYSDEHATVSGLPSSGPPSLTPHSYQVGDPASSTLFTNLLFGTLSNTNDDPSSAQSGDVATGLGLLAGTLNPGQYVKFEILLSDNGTSLPGVSITQFDPINTTDTLTVSGTILILPTAVPEPSALALGFFAAAGAVLARRFRKGSRVVRAG